MAKTKTKVDRLVTVNGYRFGELLHLSYCGGVRLWCDTAGCYVTLAGDGKTYIFDEFGHSFDPPWVEEPKIVEAAKIAARKLVEVVRG